MSSFLISNNYLNQCAFSIFSCSFILSANRRKRGPLLRRGNRAHSGAPLQNSILIPAGDPAGRLYITAIRY